MKKENEFMEKKSQLEKERDAFKDAWETGSKTVVVDLEQVLIALQMLKKL